MKPDYLDMFDHLAKWAGGLSRDPNDAAAKYMCPYKHKDGNRYHTNMDVVWNTYVSVAPHFGWPVNTGEKFYNLTHEDVQAIFKYRFWDAVDGDNYTSQAIANIFTQWAWGSGVSGALKLANSFNGSKYKSFSSIRKDINERVEISGVRFVFENLMDHRKEFLKSISMPGTKNARFRNGWMNRHEDFYNHNISRL